MQEGNPMLALEETNNASNATTVSDLVSDNSGGLDWFVGRTNQSICRRPSNHRRRDSSNQQRVRNAIRMDFSPCLPELGWWQYVRGRHSSNVGCRGVKPVFYGNQLYRPD